MFGREFEIPTFGPDLSKLEVILCKLLNKQEPSQKSDCPGIWIGAVSDSVSSLGILSPQVDCLGEPQWDHMHCFQLIGEAVSYLKGWVPPMIRKWCNGGSDL